MTRNLYISIALLLSSLFLWGQSTPDYYFFSQQDILNIRTSANSEWGKLIIDSLKNIVDERLTHPMEVPMLESGHGHQYHCPIHNKMLNFDWDSPASHYCEQCKKYWDKNPKFNWAWVNKLHYKNMDFLNACAYLYVATGEEEYARHITNLMVDYAIKYPGYMLHDIRRNQVQHESGKMFAQSLEEGVFSSYASRAYVTAKPVMSKEEIKQIEDGYFKPCAELLLRQSMKTNFWAKPNWQVWHNSGIIAIGVALGNDSIINEGLNNPVKGYYRLLEDKVFSDGWWNEGSPFYHFYTLRGILLSAEAVRCRGIDLYNEKLYDMFASPLGCLYTNLQFPSHNDGHYGESLPDEINLYEIASMRFNDKLFKDALTRTYQNNRRKSVEALQNNLDYSHRKINLKRASVNFPQTGIGVLCSDDKTVILKYGPHENSHGHPDKLSITIHDGKKEIVADLGTPAYGVPDFRRWYRRTLPHSTVSVDAKDQTPSKGELVSFKPMSNGGTIEANANEAYKGVQMNRVLRLTGNKLSDVFTAQSDTEHTYDLMLMLTEKPEFSTSALPAELNESEVYECIRNAGKINVNKEISFIAAGHKIKIKSLLADNFDVYIGEAPGIPYSKIIHDKEGSHSQSSGYPVMIRIKGWNMKIETTWSFK